MPSVHRQTFVDLVRRSGWTRGAELGVDKGILTGMLIKGCPELHLTAVDIFPDRQRSRRAFELAQSEPDRLYLLEMTTVDAAALIDDASLDFVFIDADHSFDAVRLDINHWLSKVRVGGWVGGHDYHPRKFPGVVQAVDDFFGRGVVKHWPGTIWGVEC